MDNSEYSTKDKKLYTFLIKSINLGKKVYGLPKKEKRISTNFIQ